MAKQSSVKKAAAASMGVEEKIELIELLEERMPPDWETRGGRIIEAERRLKSIGKEWRWAELLQRAVHHDQALRRGEDDGLTFTEDEFAIVNAGFRNHREIEEAHAEWERRSANDSVNGIALSVLREWAEILKAQPNAACGARITHALTAARAAGLILE